MWQDILTYIERRVTKTPDGCWLWTRTCGTRGYGQLRAFGVTLSVHRVALSARLGRWLGSDEMACHRCDIRQCCAPAHLFVGTQAENIADAVAKGRMHDIEPASIDDLLAQGLSKAAVARQLGCSPRTVFRRAAQLRELATLLAGV